MSNQVGKEMTVIYIKRRAIYIRGEEKWWETEGHGFIRMEEEMEIQRSVLP